MRTQTPISVRINSYLLDELDKEARLGYQNRNQLINNAVRFFLEMKDEQRRSQNEMPTVPFYWKELLLR